MIEEWGEGLMVNEKYEGCLNFVFSEINLEGDLMRC